MKNTHGTRTKRVACALSALALTLTLAPNGAQTALASNTEAHYTSGFVSAQEQSAGNLLNSDRARYGLAALTIDPELSRIARIKSEDMRSTVFRTHLPNIRRCAQHADPDGLLLCIGLRKHCAPRHRGKGASGIPLLTRAPAQCAEQKLYARGHRHSL